MNRTRGLIPIVLLALAACEKDDVTGVDAGTPVVKRVFVTKATYTGNLRSAGAAATGVAGGDKLCALAAESVSLGGTWKAWLSVDGQRAMDRILDVGPWFTVDGTKRVFDNRAGMSKPPLYPIEKDEYGEVLDEQVWTGTRDDGSFDQLFHCDYWSTSSTNTGGVSGRSGAIDSWTYYGGWPLDCSHLMHLYCIEQ